MIDKIRRIINNTYNLTQEEIDLEEKIWSDRVTYCWGIDTELAPTEEQSETKRKQKEYLHEYYITHRKKQTTKVMDMSERAIKTRATMAKFRNRLCLYEGEEVKYGTLMARMHNKLGDSWPDAKKIADESLIKE